MYKVCEDVALVEVTNYDDGDEELVLCQENGHYKQRFSS